MKVFVKSFGCAENKAEGEMIKGLLQKEGNKISSEKESDSVIYNICTVKGHKSILKEIRAFKQNNPKKKLIIAGCVTTDIVAPIKEIIPEASFITSNSITAIKEIIHKAPNLYAEAECNDKILLPRIRENNAIGIITIEKGCLNNCSFCSTKIIKGNLQSYPEEKVIAEAAISIKEGCKELWLTGQDTACYGFDIDTNLAKLVEKITRIPGDFKIRIGMGNPRHLKNYLDELIPVLKNDKVFRFIHLPIQSGSNKVLTAMLRGHDIELFRQMIQKIRKEIPEINISTDIIVGFPGETEKEFMETYELAKQLRFDTVNLARFVARPGTKAFLMKEQIPLSIQKQRSKKLTDLCRGISEEKNKKWIGWRGEITLTEKGKYGKSWIGRNYAYKPVAIKGKYFLGQKLKVKITNATKFTLHAEINVD